MSKWSCRIAQRIAQWIAQRIAQWIAQRIAQWMAQWIAQCPPLKNLAIRFYNLQKSGARILLHAATPFPP